MIVFELLMSIYFQHQTSESANIELVEYLTRIADVPYLYGQGKNVTYDFAQAETHVAKQYISGITGCY
jgi:hypothetical protein